MVDAHKLGHGDRHGDHGSMDSRREHMVCMCVFVCVCVCVRMGVGKKMRRDETSRGTTSSSS